MKRALTMAEYLQKRRSRDPLLVAARATVSRETVSNGRKAYWSAAEIATLRRLRLEEGWTTAKIADYLGRGHAAVRTKLARLDVNRQGARRKPPSSTSSPSNGEDLPA